MQKQLKEKCDEFVKTNMNKCNSLNITRGVHFVQIRAYNDIMVALFFPVYPQLEVSIHTSLTF